MKFFIANTITAVFKEMADSLLNDPEFISSPRGKLTHEINNAVIQINKPENNLFYNVIRSTDQRYLRNELKLYFSGVRDSESFAKASKFWKQLETKSGTINSAYGYLIFKEKNEFDKTEWQWAFESLQRDKDTRQALIRFNKPSMSYDGNSDFVCTLSAIFDIRDNKLNLTVHRRSQDIHFGFPYDMAWESLMQQNMLLLLKDTYPELELGTYTLFCKSLHMYEKDFSVYRDSLKHEWKSMQAPRMVRPLVDHTGQWIDYSTSDAFLLWLNH